MQQPGDTKISAGDIERWLGPFDQLDFLGEGAFGTTYRAARGDDQFALKVIHQLAMPEYLLRREAKSVESIVHPNVVGFRRADTCVVDGRPIHYLEFEYIAGGTVLQAFETGRFPRSEQELRGFCAGLLSGVHTLEQQGVYHRDIKPANIALRGGSWLEPVILDFGLARIANMSTHSEYPMRIGTEVYMSPEQLRGERATSRSDLFAAGLVTFQAGTKRHPFIDDSVRTIPQLLARMEAAPPIDPRRLSTIWTDGIAELVLRLLSYEPFERLSVSAALSEVGG